MSGFGPMLSFELDGARVDPTGFVHRLRLIKPAVSLGDIEQIDDLIEDPALAMG